MLLPRGIRLRGEGILSPRPPTFIHPIQVLERGRGHARFLTSVIAWYTVRSPKIARQCKVRRAPIEQCLPQKHARKTNVCPPLAISTLPMPLSFDQRTQRLVSFYTILYGTTHKFHLRPIKQKCGSSEVEITSPSYTVSGCPPFQIV